MIEPSLLERIQNRIRFYPFIAFFIREVHRFAKVFFQTIFIPVMNSSLYLVIFGVSLGKKLDLDLSVSYLEFIIPGLVMMSCLSNAFQNGSSSILSLKYAGDILDLKASPLTVQQTLWALAFGGVCRGMLVGGFVFLVSQVFHRIYIGSWLIPFSYFYLFLFMILAGLVFSKVGVAIALWAKTIDHIGAIGGLVITPLTYLGGVFFSLNILSPFWKMASFVNPVLYFINGIRYSLLGISDVPIQVCLLVSVVSLLLFHAICAFTIHHSQYRRW